MIQIHTLFSRLFFVAIFLIFSLNILGQNTGEEIFKTNCMSCHTIGGGRLIGPDLYGITERREADWLKKWINSSSDLIATGDADAIAIFEDYNKVAMPSFYFDDQIYDSLISYLENPNIKEQDEAEVIETTYEQGISKSIVLALISGLLLVFIFILISAKNQLKKQLNQPTETPTETIINQVKIILAENRNVIGLSFVVFVIILKFTFDMLLGIGVTTNYQPEQPIAFSHKLHAGINGVDCNYCHSSARHSKHSGIPSANVCMNCHTYINQGPSGTKEIQKIYDAVGFDPETRTYIEGYDKKPIKWVRIHNLPDHAYFNHSQHVVAGGLECQECHGPVEEMDVLYQYSELTMGWCVECHRETEVKMEGNNYYTHLHEQLKEKYKDEKITVDKIGGLECAKCHY
tara:strand:+ start:23176 stop:24384 length:1209 start_codon:yes stop_codon:yes gene_type:complete